MGEYLSPGVYVEEFEMGAKPIEGVSTSTVGFVGVTGLEKTLPKANTMPSNADLTVSLKAVTDQLKVAIAAETAKKKSEVITAVSAMDALVDALEVEVGKITDAAKKVTAQTDLKKVNVIYGKAKEVALFLTYVDIPTFVSSWAEYVSKFGRYTSGKYLAPAVYSFFVNGGKRCFMVSVKDDSSIIGTSDDTGRTGLKSLEEIDEVSILCIPGVTSENVQSEMLSHCENMGDRFCIFDPAKGSPLATIQLQKDKLVSDKGMGALYYPWVKTAVETVDDEGKVILENMFIPPSGAMAGIYARTDTERGVHKAPANEVVRGALELEKTITKGEQDILNPLGINCIRAFQGRGIRVWGARSIAPKGSEWKYVSVRRLFLFLEESIDESTQWVVFEPNNEQLWARVVQTISNFLLGVWKSGALMGKSPEEAFFVKCDRSTMTQSDIDSGKLIVIIGLAPTKPAEFVIFKVAQFTANANN